MLAAPSLRRGVFYHCSRNTLCRTRHSKASFIDSTAVVSPTANIDYCVVIKESSQVGEDCVIGAGTVVGPGVTLGDGCIVGSGVTLLNCSVGHRTVIHSGVRVGQDGFGFVPDPNLEHKKKPQELKVAIGNEVEIGANCTIDRGSWRDTVIGDHSKLDNMVHIAHNVTMGKGCLLAAQAGVAGSVTIGDGVMLGGQVGVAQHLHIGSGARVAAKSGVSSNVPAGATYRGNPAVPFADFNRSAAWLRRLGRKRKGRAGPTNPRGGVEGGGEDLLV